jgi:TonB family protein
MIAGCASPPPVDENNRGPVMISTVIPVYPDEAKKSNAEGEVWVKMWVNEKGKVTRAMCEKTPDQSLCGAAMDAAMQTRYKPAMVDGKPTGVWLIVPFSVVRSKKH